MVDFKKQLNLLNYLMRIGQVILGLIFIYAFFSIVLPDILNTYWPSVIIKIFDFAVTLLWIVSPLIVLFIVYLGFFQNITITKKGFVVVKKKDNSFYLLYIFLIAFMIFLFYASITELMYLIS